MLHFLYSFGETVRVIVVGFFVMLGLAVLFRRFGGMRHRLVFIERIGVLWRQGVSWFVSVVMVLTSLPLSVLVPSVVYASAADAVLTNVPTGVSNTTDLDVTVTSDNSVTHYKSTVVAAADCSGVSFTGSGIARTTKITTDISSLADGSVTLCVAGSTDNTTFDTASPTAATWMKDTVAPTITGGGYNGATIGVRLVRRCGGHRMRLILLLSIQMGRRRMRYRRPLRLRGVWRRQRGVLWWY